MDPIWVFPKIGVPQIIHFNRVFHYKPSIWGTPKIPKMCHELVGKYTVPMDPIRESVCNRHVVIQRTPAARRRMDARL